MNGSSSDKSRRAEYADTTRLALLAAARASFAADGFQETGIEAISRAARVTRGALYHHFSDKRALFDAVVVSMQDETVQAVERASRKASAVWDRLHIGIEAYLDACLQPAYRRIVIQEAPAVLGDRRAREIEEAYPMALLKATLASLKRRGEIATEDTDLLARMVDAMICELAIMLPEADNPALLRRHGREIIVDRLVAAYRPADPGRRMSRLPGDTGSRKGGE